MPVPGAPTTSVIASKTSPPPSTSSSRTFAGGEPFHQVTPAVERRVSALEPNRSRTVETNCRGTTGLARNALAPAASASSARSSADIASTGASTIARQAGAEIETAAGDHQIDDRQVWSTVAAQLLGPIRVERHADVVSLGPQEVLEELRRVPIAFGEQHHDRDAFGARDGCRASASRTRSANSRWASAGVVPASTRSTTNRNRSSSSRE